MARSAGPARTLLSDFSGGMYRNAPIDALPANAAWNLENALLDLGGGQFSRGGSVYRSSAVFGSSLRWVWDGWIASGHVTLLASTTAFGRLEGSGSVTNLGEGGLASPVRPAVLAGKLFFPGGKTYDGTTWGTLAAGAGTADFVTVAANRLLVAHGERIRFSKVGDPTSFAETDFHQIPTGAQVLGLEGSRESCVVFTTRGIWVISGLTNALVDEAGNVQQRLDHYSGDVVLWGNAGVAAWEGSLVVPAIDGVWLIRRGVTSEQVASFVRISDSISDLYRGYVRDGFAPGGGAVIENHYLLPIIGEGTVVDLLVCRLDIPAARGRPQGAWTHFSGSGSRMAALATRVSSGPAREPELLGAGYVSARAYTLEVFNAASCFDADGSRINWIWQTAAIPTGNAIANLVAKIRLRYQLQPAPVEGPPTFPVSVLDALGREEVPLNNGGKWTILAGCATKGNDTAAGWAAAPGSLSGAYWNVATQTNPAVSINASLLPVETFRAFWLWACAAGGEVKSGYALKVERQSETTFRLTLELWVAGTASPLWSGIVLLENADSVGLSVRGGLLRIWRRPGSGAWVQLAEARDLTFSSGYGGIESKQSGLGLKTFSVAEILQAPSVESTPTIRAYVATDVPPAGTTAWGAFSWGEAKWASAGEAAYEVLEGEAPVDVNAAKAYRWPVRRKRRSISFRFSVDQPAQRIVVKALEVFVRLSGRI